MSEVSDTRMRQDYLSRAKEAVKEAKSGETKVELKKAEALAELAAMKANKEKFPIGTVVTLKGIDSPEMVVEGYMGDNIFCVWFSLNAAIQSRGFYGDLLEAKE